MQFLFEIGDVVVGFCAGVVVFAGYAFWMREAMARVAFDRMCAELEDRELESETWNT